MLLPLTHHQSPAEDLASRVVRVEAALALNRLAGVQLRDVRRQAAEGDSAKIPVPGPAEEVLLVEAGVDNQRLSAHGVGPLAPNDESGQSNRTEIVFYR